MASSDSNTGTDMGSAWPISRSMKIWQGAWDKAVGTPSRVRSEGKSEGLWIV